MSEAEVLDTALRSHLVDPMLLRADDFERFLSARKEMLLGLIEQATGKRCYRDEVLVAEDVDDAIDDTEDE
ncbi:hypothetical protein L0U85_12090 [Glycomyces sp. L485]|uniref:hypothetical protein n=1 Tax=Glycomyces sp. L485 TaxID=2909235 RepID=UPI001F4B9396|nr:hypothetical protein [Glycomyces sp. L485]MCH7231584.1 hypothetical protein [Glycomyces sp. L485]